MELFMVQSVSKESAWNAGDTGDRGSILPSGRVPWKRKWQPTPVLQMGNPMDRGVWQVSIHKVTKSLTKLSNQARMHHFVNLLSLYEGQGISTFHFIHFHFYLCMLIIISHSKSSYIPIVLLWSPHIYLYLTSNQMFFWTNVPACDTGFHLTFFSRCRYIVHNFTLVWCIYVLFKKCNTLYSFSPLWSWSSSDVQWNLANTFSERAYLGRYG